MNKIIFLFIFCSFNLYFVLLFLKQGAAVMQIRKSICYVFFMSLQNATPYNHTAKFQRVRQEKKQKQFN